MPLKLPQSALIFNNYIDYESDKVKVTTGPDESIDVNIFLLTAGAYYELSGGPSEFSKKSFMDSFEFLIMDSFSHAPPKSRFQQPMFLKDTEKIFPSVVALDAGENNATIPYKLYNQNFFLVTVKGRKEIFDLGLKIQDTVNVVKSDINSLSSRILLALSASKFNGYNDKVFTIDSKLIAILDHLFSTASGELAIPIVKAINNEEAFAKMVGTEKKTDQGILITELGDLAKTNKDAGFIGVGDAAGEGFAGTGFDSTGAGATDPEFGGNQGGTPSGPPPTTPGTNGPNSGGGSGY